MADKPKTYPQQVQELKQQLEDKNTIIEGLGKDLQRVTDLQLQVEVLQQQLAAKSTEDRQQSVGSKAKQTDLEQRAISAEQGIKNVTQELQRVKAENNALTQQLDIAGQERDKGLGKQAKIEQLTEELQRSNLTITQMNQRNRDQDIAHELAVSNLQRQLHEARQLAEWRDKKLQDVLTKLREIDLSKLLGI